MKKTGEENPEELKTEEKKVRKPRTKKVSEVVEEIKNIYGAFYKLDNGMYVSKGSNLTVYVN